MTKLKSTCVNLKIGKLTIDLQLYYSMSVESPERFTHSLKNFCIILCAHLSNYLLNAHKYS